MLGAYIVRFKPTPTSALSELPFERIHPSRQRRRRRRRRGSMKRKAVETKRVYLTCVCVALRDKAVLYTCTDLVELIQEYVDYPARWWNLQVPVTRTMELMRIPKSDAECRLPSTQAKALNRAMMLAAAKGYQHVMHWLDAYHGPSVRISRHVMDVAVAFGNVQVVQWLHHARSEGCSEAAMVAACELGCVGLLDWLSKNTEPECPLWTSSWVMNTSLQEFPATGVLEVVKWLHAHNVGGRFSAADMDNTASNGRLDLVQFLHETSAAGCTSNAMDNAAQNGHLQPERVISGLCDGCMQIEGRGARWGT